MFKLKPILLTVLVLGAISAQATGFQRAFAADPNGTSLAVGIWYPSQAATRPITMGPTIMSVAPEAPIDGRALPMIVISHGTGGSMLDHHDTAIALADAGYVVAAVTHGGFTTLVNIGGKPDFAKVAPMCRPCVAFTHRILLAS